jgi:hypothetical protein
VWSVPPSQAIVATFFATKDDLPTSPRSISFSLHTTAL